MAKEDNAPDPRGPRTPTTPGSTTNADKKRWNLTPMWQDPYNPPSPGDPYFQDWVKANPDYYSYYGMTDPNAGQPAPGPSQTKTTPPAAPKTYTYDEALAWTQQQAQSLWGKQLTTSDIDAIKRDLGFTPGAPINEDAGPKITAWLTAHKPAATGTGTPPPNPNGGLVPPDGTYDVPPPGLPPNVNVGDEPIYHQAAPFTAPTAQDLLQDPSYKFRFDQGINAIQSDRAARGILNSGGTAKDLLGYGQDFASQEYKNVWDRSLQGYLTNVETQNNSPYTFARSAYDTNRQFAQGQANFDYQSSYNAWVQAYNQWRNSRNDAFDQKWRIANG